MSYEVSGWQEPTLGENLARAGVKRRDFMKFCAGLAGVFAAGTQLNPGAAHAEPVTAEQIADALEGLRKPVVVWLQLQECTGCVESALRSGGTTVEEVVLRLLSVEYNEAIMAASGTWARVEGQENPVGGANKVLEDANAQPHILVVNGSIPKGKENAPFCTIGGESAEDVLRKSAENAVAILAVGACAVWGSVQASKPNPTNAVGVDEIITDKPVINVAGCPPIGEVITATVANLLANADRDAAGNVTKINLPKTDGEGRPLFAYDQRIHDSCPRRAHYDAGQYVRTFDDEAARKGWCLYDVGCKGPSTFSACPVIQWNLHTSWPIGAGHPCIGCTEKHFFDDFTPFYKTLPNFNVPGLGIESTAEKIGLGIVAATAVGVGVHATATAVRRAASRRAAEEAPLAAFGDSRVWLPDPSSKQPDAPAQQPDAPAAAQPESAPPDGPPPAAPTGDPSDPSGKAE
jgi:hydrogenase small subunit